MTGQPAASQLSQSLQESYTRAVKPAKPEPHPPENVGEARLTCGQPLQPTPFAQVSRKREDLLLSRKRCRSEAHFWASQ